MSCDCSFQSFQGINYSEGFDYRSYSSEPQRRTERRMKNAKGEEKLGRLAGTLKELSREGYEVMPDYFLKHFIWRATAEEPSEQQVGLQRAGIDCE